jgi:hypothetical protein
VGSVPITVARSSTIGHAAPTLRDSAKQISVAWSNTGIEHVDTHPVAALGVHRIRQIERQRKLIHSINAPRRVVLDDGFGRNAKIGGLKLNLPVGLNSHIIG